MTSSEADSRLLIAALERRSDIELRWSCGKSIRAHSQKLSLASSVFGDLIDAVMDVQITAMRAAKKKRDDNQTLPHITVDGKYEDWMEVLRLIYSGDFKIGPSPSELSPGAAFRILPIAQQYDFVSIRSWCEEAFQRSQLDLWPSDPIASSEVPNHPGLVQCLALADAKHCESVVQSCLSQLIRPGPVPSHDTVFDALASPHLDTLIDGLRSETKCKIIRRMAGLPEGYKATIPSVGRVKPFMTKEMKCEAGCRVYIAMSDSLVLFPHNGTTAMVWDIEDGRSLGLLEGHTSNIARASLNSIKTTAVTASDDEASEAYPVKIWSLETMQCTANLTATTWVHRLLKDRLLLGSRDGPIKVWDIGGSTPVALMGLEGLTDWTWSVDASDTSNVALSGSQDKSVRLWDLRTGQCVRVMEGHDTDVNSVSMDSACKTAASGSDDKTVKLWDLGSGRCIETYDHGQGVYDVMLHESGSSFLAFDDICILKAWALGTDKPLLDANLGSIGLGGMHFAASRDLSVVATCYRNSSRDVLGVSVWRHG